MKRFFDLFLSFMMILIVGIPMVIIAIAIKLTSKGPILYWSDRVGMKNISFRMPKFRTMKADTPTIATHLLQNPENYLTPLGKFLRRYSLDELPQVYCVITGKLSFVGPRPALYNQYDLISLRTQKKIDSLTPGITGWAQINGRDELPIPIKVDYDEYYLKTRSIWFDLRILLRTFCKVIKCDGVIH